MGKHIVIDARESGTTSGRYVDKLIEYLHKLPHEHDFTLLSKPHRVTYLHDIAPSFKIIETQHKEFSFAEQIGFKKLIDSLQPDLVHFPMVQQPAFYQGKVVTTMQDLTTVRFRNPSKNPVIFWLKQRVYVWLNKRIAHKSSLLITPTQFVKDDVVDFCHVSPSKITVTYEAADVLPDGSAPFTPVEGNSFIMYIGRPTPHKNLARLIDAFVLLQKTHPELRLVLAGKKDENYLIHERNVAKKNIGNIIFTGFIADDQYRWLLENCRAYVFPSLSEGFGLPGLEAMLHGAPVVASNATCIPEVLGDAAEYFDPLDTLDMAKKIESVLFDEAKRSKMIAAGKRQAATYSWQRMAAQTLAVYEQALGRQT